jgi:hypothetical protein
MWPLQDGRILCSTIATRALALIRVGIRLDEDYRESLATALFWDGQFYCPWLAFDSQERLYITDEQITHQFLFD